MEKSQARTLIRKLKVHFARSDRIGKVHSDSGLQYAVTEFK